MSTIFYTFEKKMEIWKDIKDYEGLYQVSNTGLVKSLPRLTTKGRILVQNEDKDGYFKVTLSKQGAHKQFSVHRLVAEHFLNNPNDLKIINHKDENKHNNIVDNLEWCTSSYNINYGGCISRRSSNRKRPILQYSEDMQFVQEFAGGVDAEIQTGISRKLISACLRGTHKTAGGFIWRYKTT